MVEPQEEKLPKDTGASPSAPIQPQNQEMPPASPSPLKQIRTFQGDVAEALDKQQESLVSIQQMAYEKKRANPELNVSEEDIEKKRKHLIYLSLGTFFLIVLGLLGGSYSYNEYKSRTAPPVLSVPSNRFISPTAEVTVDISGIDFSRESLINTFGEMVGGIPSSELRHVVLRKGEGDIAPLVKTSELFALLESQAPGSLVRAFNDLFMLGALGESRFIIIKLSSFENAFPGMLAWETNMVADIGTLLVPAESLKAIDSTYVFKDVIVKNKDVRLVEGLVNGAPEPVLIYSFFDNNMLIITDRLTTLEVLLERLTRAKLSR